MDATNSPAADFQRQQERKRKRKAILAGGVVLGLGAAVTLAAWSDDVFADGTFNTGGSFELVGSTTWDSVNDTYDYRHYDGPDGLIAETAALSFNINASEMVPSETVYAPLTIATASGTNKAGEFFIDDVSATGPYAPLLTYRVFTEASHGANCSAAKAGALTDEWTDPTPEALTAIVGGLSFLRSIPLVGPIVGGLLNTVLTSLTATTRPVIDATTLTELDKLSVGADSASPQHLCIAVTMGILPPGGALDSTVRNINETAVQNITAGDTTVTWKFNGSPVAP